MVRPMLVSLVRTTVLQDQHSPLLRRALSWLIGLRPFGITTIYIMWGCRLARPLTIPRLDLVKRTGRGLTMDLNYTWSRQRGDTYTSAQEYNAYYTPVQDFGNMSAAANSLTSYDLTHVVKGFVTYQLPFGQGQRWLSGKGRFVNDLVGGWQLSGLVSYFSGQPFHIGINEPFYPIWGDFYPNFNSQGAHSANPSGFTGGYYPYFPQSVATAPVSIDGSVVGLGSGGAYDGSLRCPGQANENASLLKYLYFGAEGK